MRWTWMTTPVSTHASSSQSMQARPALKMKGLPNIKAMKKSEHATEWETVMLGCKLDSFPLVSNWVWYKWKLQGPGHQ